MIIVWDFTKMQVCPYILVNISLLPNAFDELEITQQSTLKFWLSEKKTPKSLWLIEQYLFDDILSFLGK